MIPKKREDYQFNVGEGRPFEVNERGPIARNDTERQKAIVVDLSDLNGQNTDKGMPKNFVRKAGRVLPTFNTYWTTKGMKEDIDEAFDVE